MKHVLKDKGNRLFLILGGFFITNALIAEFVGGKIFSLEKTFGFSQVQWAFFGEANLSLDLTAGVILWPVVFVMTDIINEYFGQRGIRFLSYMAVGLISYAFAMVYGAIHLVPADWWPAAYQNKGVVDAQLAFAVVFGQGLWIIVGSIIAFLVAQIVDVFVFHRIKKVTGEGKIWLRATGSTLISQFIDSFVVLFIAFYIGADWGFFKVLAIGLVSYSYKFLMAIILTPVIYLAHYFIDRYLGEKLARNMKRNAAM